MSILIKFRLELNDLTKKWREEERKAEAALEYAKSVKKENDNLKTQKGYIRSILY